MIRQEAAIPGCLDENAVAGLHEGRLAPDERQVVRAHLLACAACREWVGALEAADVLPASATETAPPMLRILGWRALAIAATLLLALGAGWWVLRREAGPAATAPSPLEAAAGHAGVTLLSAAELRDGALGLERGGLVVLEPRGAVLEVRPQVRWTPVAAATGVRVTVRDADGVLRLDAPAVGTGLAWPADQDPLPVGESYVVRVVVQTPAGEVVGAQTFRAPSQAERAAYTAEHARIDAGTEPGLRALLRAHAAARRELWTEADRWLVQAAADGAPAEPRAALAAFVDGHLGRAGP